ncbi:WSC domain-containing protein 2, partial [Opisthocomus hoazin]
RDEDAMAKLLVKLQRYFRRKPLRFLTLLALYLAAGSLVFLHSGFAREPAVTGSQRGPGAGEEQGSPHLIWSCAARCPGAFPEPLSQGAGARALGGTAGGALGAVEKQLLGLGSGGPEETGASPLVSPRQDSAAAAQGQRPVATAQAPGFLQDGVSLCQHPGNGALRASSAITSMPGSSSRAWGMQGDSGVVFGVQPPLLVAGPASPSVWPLSLADGSAIFRGCFRRPDNVSIALPVSQLMLNMSVDKCVDFCTEKGCPWALGNLGMSGKLTNDVPRECQCPEHCSGGFWVSAASCLCSRLEGCCGQLGGCCDPPRAARPGWVQGAEEVLAPGFYTGSYYFDGSLYNKGFKGERDHWRSGRTICIKTHESGQKEIESFDSAILLIRNPYKALMAEFNRKYGGHIGFAAHAHWKGKEWPEFVANYAPWWATHTLDWLRYGKKVLVVHFEDLKRDLFAQLQRMVGLLGIAACEDRLLCVEGQKDGNFKRSGLRKLEYDPYTPEMRKVSSSYIKTVDTALKLRNLSGVPDDYYPR